MTDFEDCRFGHICTSGCGNDFDCPCQADHCCAMTADCEGAEYCDDHYAPKNPAAIAAGFFVLYWLAVILIATHYGIHLEG